MLTTKQLLLQVGSLPFDATLDNVKELAEAVWYQGYRPARAELDQVRPYLSAEGFQRLLCVLELLSQYPVCPREAARYIQQLTRHFHELLLGGDDMPEQGRYSPSERWQLADKTTDLRKALLPIQTRLYADSMSANHGFTARETRI